MQNILDIIYLYSMKEKILDKIAISRILDLLYIENNFESNKEVHFLSGKAKQVAYYTNDEMFIFMDEINNAIKGGYYKSPFKLEDNMSFYEDFLRKNLFIAQVLFHEFEHALQDKLEKKDTLENRLINVETNFIKDTENILNDKSIGIFKRRAMFKHNKELYSKNYDISLLERLADIKSYEKIIAMTDGIKDKYKNLYDLEKLLLMYTKMKNYTNPNDKPTIRFFKNINKFDEVSDIDYNMSDINREDRLKLGLKVDAEDFYNNKNEISLQLKKRS